jgi:hypothetical protein
VNKWIVKLSTAERIELARAKMPSIVDQVTALLALHEANRIITYSDTLSKQVPRSRAAHAFNLFQRSSFAFELVRLCALWDKADQNRDSIPTIAALVDDPDVLSALGNDIRGAWPDDWSFGNSQAAKLTRGLRRGVSLVPAICGSARFKNLVNHRDKNIAHALSQSHAEAKGTVFQQPKYGYERKLLNVSISLVDRFYLGISNTSFAFDGSREIARGNAKALWSNCRFDIAP